MRKFVLLLLIAAMVIVGDSYAAGPVIVSKNDRAVVQLKNAALLSSFVKCTPPPGEEIQTIVELAQPPAENEPKAKPVVEQSHYCDSIPLTFEEQGWLRAACEEFNIPYALALGLIEKETEFRNLIGDDGASTGYMQIQKKWHWDRMERLGVTDLMEPSGNFRVGCDFLAELYAKYNDWSLALTVYNRGHNPGYITDYAKEVMENYAHWQEIVENYI